MGLFKDELTELEIIIEENFNSVDREEYNFEIETEGEFVKIKIPTVIEEIPEGENDGDNVSSGSKLSDK